MKSVFYKLMAIMMVAMLSVSFVSCGDDGNNGGSATDSALIGTWQRIREDNSLSNDVLIFTSSGYMYNKDLNDDGTYEEKKTETYKYKIVDGHIHVDEYEKKDNKGFEGKWQDMGAYSVSNGILTIGSKRLKKIG